MNLARNKIQIAPVPSLPWASNPLIGAAAASGSAFSTPLRDWRIRGTSTACLKRTDREVSDILVPANRGDVSREFSGLEKNQ